MMDIKMVKIDDIVPYENNAKRHPDDQVEHIANSIKEFGFRQPLVIDQNNVVVIGHGRLLAAKRLGMGEVPVLYADGLTDAQVNALRLADNKTNESEWDFDALEKELADLNIDFDMSEFGFDAPGGGMGDGDAEPPISTEQTFNYQEQYGVIVMCRDETEQEAVYNRLIGEGFECKVVAT